MTKPIGFYAEEFWAVPMPGQDDASNAQDITRVDYERWRSAYVAFFDAVKEISIRFNGPDDHGSWLIHGDWPMWDELRGGTQ